MSYKFSMPNRGFQKITMSKNLCWLTKFLATLGEAFMNNKLSCNKLERSSLRASMLLTIVSARAVDFLSFQTYFTHLVRHVIS